MSGAGLGHAAPPATDVAGPSRPGGRSGGTTRLLAGALVRSALRGEVASSGPHLVVRTGGREEEVVALPPDLTLGRGPGVDLVLDDPGASRRHARIRLAEDGTAEVLDLGSKNGSLLNGRRLPPGPVALRPGDELTVGDTGLRFVDPLADPPPGGPGPPAGTGQDGRPPSRSGADGPRARSRLRAAPAWPAAAPPEWAFLAGAAALLALAGLLLALG